MKHRIYFTKFVQHRISKIRNLSKQPKNDILYLNIFYERQFPFKVEAFIIHLLLSLLGNFFFSETKLAPIFFCHQIVLHSTLEVVFRFDSTLRVFVRVMRETHHVLDHQLFAQAFVVERKTTLVGWRRGKLLLTERHRRHFAFHKL